MPSSAPPSRPSEVPTAAEIAHPTLEDGHAMWRMARDSQVLDVNAPYAYLLWCRDFARTSLVATVGGEPAGFVTGYRRPDEPDTLMVWQVAVDAAHRGQRLASRLLDRLAEVVRPQRLETTITPDNKASIGLFTRFAEDRGAGIEQHPVFDAALFPAGHETELLFRIGPLG